MSCDLTNRKATGLEGQIHRKQEVDRTYKANTNDYLQIQSSSLYGLPALLVLLPQARDTKGGDYNETVIKNSIPLETSLLC